MSVKTNEFVFLIGENKRLRYLPEPGLLFVEEPLYMETWIAVEVMAIKRNLNLTQVCTLVSLFEHQ